MEYRLWNMSRTSGLWSQVSVRASEVESDHSQRKTQKIIFGVLLFYKIKWWEFDFIQIPS